MPLSTQQALASLQAAAAERKVSQGALLNIQAWLTEPRYAEYAPQVVEHIAGGKWQELDDAFWTIIPFGTGGRRGKMYPIGSNTINDRTIGESAQGLAEYAAEVKPEGRPLSCAIAYDTRHRSRHFAELCAEIMVANGFTVYFLDGYRSTPELSFTVRHKQCSCGIMVTASHNPPSDNAVKCYWSSGAQLLPPHDKSDHRSCDERGRDRAGPLRGGAGARARWSTASRRSTPLTWRTSLLKASAARARSRSSIRRCTESAR